MKENVLDKGFIEVVDSLGNDLTVVNSARVSFGKRKTKYDNSDRKLVRFLAKYKLMINFAGASSRRRTHHWSWSWKVY